MEKPSNEPPSNKKRNILLTTLAIFAIVVVGFAGTDYGDRLRSEISEHLLAQNITTSVCKTKECIQLGAKMISMMDLKVDPCDDFYEYACGNYKGRTNHETQNLKYVEEKNLKKLLKFYKPQTDSERISLIFIDKCMSTKKDLDVDQEIWKSDDLTDILLEMSKIDPIHTGFIKNRILFKPYNGRKKLALHLRNGIEDDSDENQNFFQLLKKVADEVLILNPHLENANFVDLHEVKISSIDLEKYYLGLLPEEYREEYEDRWEVEVDRNEMILLDQVVKKLGVKKIKGYLYEKWRKTLEGYLVKSKNAYGSCFNKAEKLFPGTFAMIFVKNFVNPRNIEIVNRLFEEVKVAFNEMLDENTWIDVDLKNNLREELKVLKSSIGIPDEHKDLNNIDRMYARVEKEQKVEDQSYLTLVRNLLKMNSEETFLRVARGESVTYVGTRSSSANFFGSSHRITQSPAYLNWPDIDQNLPEWNMVASVGRTIGHEIGHAFDATGFYSNQASEKYRMKKKVKKEFSKRIKCIIKKYDKFQFPDGSFSNGVHTKQEDSADFIGFDLAYRLFKKLGKQQKLHGFEEYTVEQSYFLRMGYHACARRLDEKSIKKQKKDVHSAKKFRINGVMSNSKDFARAFKCEKNSPMNPEKKCPLFKRRYL